MEKKKKYWITIIPSKIHARKQSEARNTPIPKGIDLYNPRAYWCNAKIDDRGDVCIEMWLPYGTKGMYRGYPLVFKDRRLAVSKTAMHGRTKKRVERKMTQDIEQFKLIVDYLGL